MKITENSVKFDFNNIGKEEAEKIGEELGEKLRLITDKACDEANALCKIYGLKVVMQFCLEPQQK